MLERMMSLLGLVDPGSDEDKKDEVAESYDMETREKRVLKSVPEHAALIVVRGLEGVCRKEELAEALRKGKMLLIDLRGLDKDVGQGLLDFLCGVTFANRGTVLRAAGGVFLAAPRKSMIEEWEEE